MPRPAIEVFIKNGQVAHEENTMRSSSQRSGQVSLQRLVYRYRNIDLQDAAYSLCKYLRARGDKTDLFDRYRVAERALYPEFGAVALHDQTLQATLLYWVAANEISPLIKSSIADRRECIVRALCESQRGNNAADQVGNNMNSASINFVDDRNSLDCSICLKGVINKFAEVLYAMHPDVVLVEDLNIAIYDLIRGFIAKYLYSIGKDYKDLINPLLDLSDKNILPIRQIRFIKTSLIKIFGVDDKLAYSGLLTDAEMRYIDETLSDMILCSLTFIEHKPNLPPTVLSKDDIAGLIRDVDFRLQEVIRQPIIKHVSLGSAQLNINFYPASIKDTIKSLLPLPANKAKVYGDINLEIRSFPQSNIVLKNTAPSMFAWALFVANEYKEYFYDRVTEFTYPLDIATSLNQTATQYDEKNVDSTAEQTNSMSSRASITAD